MRSSVKKNDSGKASGRSRRVSEESARLVLALYRDRERRLSVPELAARCGLSAAATRQIIKGYQDGTIDADGLKTAPLFPEVFRPEYASPQLSFRF